MRSVTPIRYAQFKRDVVAVARIMTELSLVLSRHKNPPNPLDTPSSCRERFDVAGSSGDPGDERDTELGRAMSVVYEYAVNAKRSLGVRPFDASDTYRRVVTCLRLLRSGAQDCGFAKTALEAVERCYALCELADARLRLEGEAPLLDAVGTERQDHAELTLRDLSLLSGLPEDEIRRELLVATDADPHTPPEKVTASTAMQWLIGRGAYQPVSTRWAGRQFNLHQSYLDTGEFLLAVIVRVRELAAECGDAAVCRVNIVVRQFGHASYQQIAGTGLQDAQFTEALADVLELPKSLFVLRAREAWARETLARTECELIVAGEPTDCGTGQEP